MAQSSNPRIQSLMDEVDSLDANDNSLEAKLQKIAEAVAAEQAKLLPKKQANNDMPVDPADAFACEGCQ